MRLAARVVLAVLAAPALATCGGGGTTTLAIDVKTDFTPRAEFARVETVVWSVDAAGIRSEPQDVWLGVSGTESFSTGVRVGELRVPNGTVDVITTLVGPAGGAVAERITRVTASGSPLAITVLVTRSCAGVVCGVTSDGLPQTCSSGRCVDPRCMPGSAACDAECLADADCTSGGSACTISHCVSGTCFRVPDDTRCSAGEHCSVTSGCVRDSACAAGCALVHATSTCTATGCAITACDPGWHDCDVAPEDGCECPVQSCRDVLRLGVGTTSGTYPLHTRFGEDVTMYCEMTVDGGGWALLMNVPAPTAGPVPVVDMVTPTVYGRLADSRFAALLDGAEPGNNVRVSMSGSCCLGEFGGVARYPSYGVPVSPLAYLIPEPIDMTSGLTSFGYTRYPEYVATTMNAAAWSFTTRYDTSIGGGNIHCSTDLGCGGPDMTIWAQTGTGAIWAR